MTAIAEDLDLSWATFLTGHADESCDGWLREDCGLEAVVLAWWAPVCACHTNPFRLCAGHRDELAAAEAASPGAPWVCDICGARAFLVRVEPIR